MEKITEEEYLKAKEIVWQYANQVDSFKSKGKVPWGRGYLMALLPREDRGLNKAVAKFFGYFWLPCEICGEEFAGFEWLDDHVIRERGKLGRGVCYKPECGLEAKKRSDHMALNDNLKTRSKMDVQLIEKTRDKIAPLIAGEFPDKKTREKVKKLMEAFLPDYEIKCDEENNPSEIVDSGNVMVRVQTHPSFNLSYDHIDVIF